MRSISQLREALQHGAEHLKQSLDSAKRSVDCGFTAACFLLEYLTNDQRDDQAATPARGDACELLTTIQLAERLNYSIRQIQKWKTQGLPYVGKGRGTRFRLDKVVEWIDQHYQKTNRVERAGNGKIAQAPIKTRLQAKRT